jgi:pimeloyl-ACP methyl ester carboxylesterase
MSPQGVPVVLVHGWRSHPGIWNRLVPSLEQERIPFWNFDHAAMSSSSVGEIAGCLQDYIAGMRERYHYAGQIDLVCHSMGTCIARYLFEVNDGKLRHELVRKLIGIGPPNNGSALAELFNRPEIGPAIIERLSGIFVPRGFDPSADRIVQEFRPGSTTMSTLRMAGLRLDISYHIICAANRTGTPHFFPSFDGMTYELLEDGRWRMTCAGDGIVPHSDSVLPGAGLTIVPANPAALITCHDQYCHIRLPRNPEVIERIIFLLKNPEGSSILKE